LGKLIETRGLKLRGLARELVLESEVRVARVIGNDEDNVRARRLRLSEGSGGDDPNAEGESKPA
jgi:hypothetical protein